MPIAAVPQYLGDNFEDASPGMRFGMYLKLWGINRRTRAFLWQTHDIDYEVRGPRKEEREVKCENKVFALGEAKKLKPNDQETLRHLAKRQSALAGTIPDGQLLRLDAVAVAPFTTGLGNEHPLENGFAFLWPYGLPYLPGSGVKGVLRQAARELASGDWGNTHGWSDEPRYPLMQGEGKNKPPVLDSRGHPVMLSMIDILFGRETPSGESEHVRGALTFWDVIPQVPGNSLWVEVMTPHQSHYYQQKQERKAGDSVTPHDSGQPTPIFFLTVPPGSQFTFHVVCDTTHLARLTQNKLDGAFDLLAEEDDKPRWQGLVEAAFEHAFEWLGFGAKTAVGYGAMKRESAQNQPQTETSPSPRPSQVLKQTESWPQARLEYKPNTGQVFASFQGRKTALIDINLLDLPPAVVANLKKKKAVFAPVKVRCLGNMIELVEVKSCE